MFQGNLRAQAPRFRAGVIIRRRSQRWISYTNFYHCTGRTRPWLYLYNLWVDLSNLSATLQVSAKPFECRKSAINEAKCSLVSWKCLSGSKHFSEDPLPPRSAIQQIVFFNLTAETSSISLKIHVHGRYSAGVLEKLPEQDVTYVHHNTDILKHKSRRYENWNKRFVACYVPLDLI